MRERLQSEWFTAAAVVLLLFGSYALNSRGVTLVAAALLAVGLVFMRKDRVRGGLAAVVALAVAATMVVLLRLLR